MRDRDDDMPVSIAASAGRDLIVVVLIGLCAALLVSWRAILGIG